MDLMRVDQLDVYVSGTLAGTLTRTGINTYEFVYRKDAPVRAQVSLLMPLRAEPYTSQNDVPPAFQVSIPEGALHELLRAQFGQKFETFGSMEVLSIVGSNLLGRVRLALPGKKPLDASRPVVAQNLVDALSPEAALAFLNEQARYSGVSGGFLKVAGKSPGAAGYVQQDHVTQFFDRWILKTNNERAPDLALNEFLSLELARRCGLSVPRYVLSEDDTRILIERFDVGVDEERLGFEDMCALLAMDSAMKFSGSVERIARTIEQLVDVRHVPEDLERFFRQYLVCMVMRNGDAHLKNFGLLYEHPMRARLSPAYDMVTMSVYDDRRTPDGDTQDAPALSFGGTRRWFKRKEIDLFARRCMVLRERQRVIEREIAAGMLAQAQASVHYLERAKSGTAPITVDRMLELWARGIAPIDAEVSAQIDGLRAGINIEERHKAAVRARPKLAWERY